MTITRVYVAAQAATPCSYFYSVEDLLSYRLAEAARDFKALRDRWRATLPRSCIEPLDAVIAVARSEEARLSRRRMRAIGR